MDDAYLKKLLTYSLKWKEEARTKREPVYIGDSERTMYRRKKAKSAMVDSSKGCIDIRNFFPAPNAEEITNTVDRN